MSSIKLENLTVIYKNEKSGAHVYALDNINATFEHGKTTVILGASGSGKTSLLDAIVGSVGINGKIYFNDVDISNIPTTRRNLSYVSQEYSLYPHLTVFENIAFPLQIIGATKQEIIRRVKEIAKFLDIEATLTRLPREISIGQRQKVAFARAIVKRSDIYLFDEPFSNLDKEKIEKMRIELRNTLKAYDATAIFVTHNAEDAYLLGDYIYVIEEGKIIFSGTVIDMNNCKDPNITPYFAIDNQNV